MHWQLMMIVAFLLILYAAELILVCIVKGYYDSSPRQVRWWRRREIEPKVKYLVILLVAAILVASITVFVSTYQPGDYWSVCCTVGRRATPVVQHWCETIISTRRQ